MTLDGFALYWQVSCLAGCLFLAGYVAYGFQHGFTWWLLPLAGVHAWTIAVGIPLVAYAIRYDGDILALVGA